MVRAYEFVSGNADVWLEQNRVDSYPGGGTDMLELSARIGDAYDSEQCYTYEGDECWVVRERQPHAGPCGTPDTDV